MGHIVLIIGLMMFRVESILRLGEDCVNCWYVPSTGRLVFLFLGSPVKSMQGVHLLPALWPAISPSPLLRQGIIVRTFERFDVGESPLAG